MSIVVDYVDGIVVRIKRVLRGFISSSIFTGLRIVEMVLDTVEQIKHYHI